jgi:hypothetical protein
VHSCWTSWSARRSSTLGLAISAVAALAPIAAGCARSDQTARESSVEVTTTTTISDVTTTTIREATSTTIREPVIAADDRPAEFLSAYLGALDLPASLVPNLEEVGDCDLDALAEGLPVVLSRQVDAKTLDASDFVVTTSSGNTAAPACARLAPADDDDELQTVLLVGELGSVEDQPARISITGELLAVDGTDLSGLETDDINTFEDGPEVVLAKIGPAQEHCRSLGSTDEIQTTWQGGVTGPRNSEPGADQLDGFTVVDVGGALFPILGFDDLGDGDNYVVVCIPAGLAPATLEVRAATLFDPTNNPNPETNATVTDS